MAHKQNTFPMTKFEWLWTNMQGARVMFVFAMLGTVAYNVLQLTVPFVTSKLVDMFLSGDDAAYNRANNLPVFYNLLIIMIGLTVVRVVIEIGRASCRERV